MTVGVRRHRYVYYTVAIGRVSDARRRVVAMQDALHAATGCRGRLMRRPETHDGRQTWMEVYEDVDDAFDAALARAVDDGGLAADDGVGARHVERFDEACDDDPSTGPGRCA